jgi:acetylornithine deacetylase/succinyl-diaminopimelate desuccinylase-like protein
MYDFLGPLFEIIRLKTYIEEEKERCANIIKQMLEKLLMITSLIKEESGSPIVIAQSKCADNNAILFYSHYDVKPEGDVSLWASNPFEPTIRDGRLFARGSGDAKGQLFSIIKGIEKYINIYSQDSLNIKLIFEGDEESNSINLFKTCFKYRHFLQCKFIVIIDSHWYNDLPLVTYGTRGHASFILSLEEEKKKEYHAGNYGGLFPGAAKKMIDKLVDLWEPKGCFQKIFLEGCDNDPLIIFPPAITLCSIESGNMIRSLIPGVCRAHVDMRFLCGQNIDFIIDYFTNKMFNSIKVDVRLRQKGYPYKSQPVNWHLELLKESILESFEIEPIITPYSAASLPCELLSVIGVPIYVFPLAQSDENNHSCNENILVINILKGSDAIYNIILKNSV